MTTSERHSCETCELATELAEERIENARLRSALEKIAGTDWRGNRSVESCIASDALVVTQ